MNIERTIKKPSLTFKQQISLIFIDLYKEEFTDCVRNEYGEISLDRDGYEKIEKIRFLTETLINELE